MEEAAVMEEDTVQADGQSPFPQDGQVGLTTNTSTTPTVDS